MPWLVLVAIISIIILLAIVHSNQKKANQALNSLHTLDDDIGKVLEHYLPAVDEVSKPKKKKKPKSLKKKKDESIAGDNSSESPESRVIQKVGS